MNPISKAQHQGKGTLKLLEVQRTSAFSTVTTREDMRRLLKVRRATTENCMSAVAIRWYYAGGRVFGQGCRRW